VLGRQVGPARSVRDQEAAHDQAIALLAAEGRVGISRRLSPANRDGTSTPIRGSQRSASDGWTAPEPRSRLDGLLLTGAYCRFYTYLGCTQSSASSGTRSGRSPPPRRWSGASPGSPSRRFRSAWLGELINKGLALGQLGQPEHAIAAFEEVERRFAGAPEPGSTYPIAAGKSAGSSCIRIGQDVVIRSRKRGLSRDAGA
jgi:hypothetical protein